MGGGSLCTMLDVVLLDALDTAGWTLLAKKWDAT